ncbi:MAG: FdtA/QdtA family cupin domain-containing protein [Mariprofundaceae bacterium]|nr:FdtA/QdtA family cupin domain-containing protein [Mariprofundaceae bacterium]
MNTKTGNLTQCGIVEFPKVSDDRGSLTFLEAGHHIPFEIKRVYYSYDIPDVDSVRGAHGHKKLEQVIIAMSGSFSVTLSDGFCEKTFHLNRAWRGLYVAPGMWRLVENFSSGAVCMVLASALYNPDDYIRDYDAFCQYVRA